MIHEDHQTLPLPEAKFIALRRSRRQLRLGFDGQPITLDLAPRSVSLLKLIDPSVAPVAPALAVSVPPTVEVGKDALFSAKPEPGSVPVTACRWSFGDGTSAEGKVVTHTYTRADTFTGKLACDGLDGIAFEKSFPVTAVGHVDTRFTPGRNRRPGAD